MSTPMRPVARPAIRRRRRIAVLLAIFLAGGAIGVLFGGLLGWALDREPGPPAAAAQGLAPEPLRARGLLTSPVYSYLPVVLERAALSRDWLDLPEALALLEGLDTAPEVVRVGRAEAPTRVDFAILRGPDGLETTLDVVQGQGAAQRLQDVLDLRNLVCGRCVRYGILQNVVLETQGEGDSYQTYLDALLGACRVDPRCDVDTVRLLPRR